MELGLIEVQLLVRHSGVNKLILQAEYDVQV